MSRMIPQKETLTIEFKSDKKKDGDANLFEDVIAFANTDGGDLYLGVEDDGEITCVHKDHANPITLSAFIANNTVPPISTRVEIVEEQLPVLKITVLKSYGGIVATCSGKILRYRLKIDGSQQRVYFQRRCDEPASCKGFKGLRTAETVSRRRLFNPC